MRRCVGATRMIPQEKKALVRRRRIPRPKSPCLPVGQAVIMVAGGGVWALLATRSPRI